MRLSVPPGLLLDLGRDVGKKCRIVGVWLRCTTFARGLDGGSGEELQAHRIICHDLLDAHLPLGERARLIGAQQGDVAEVLHRGEPFDDHLLFGQLRGPAGKRHGGNHRQRLRHDGDGQGDDEQQQLRQMGEITGQQQLGHKRECEGHEHHPNEQGAEGL